MKIENEITGEIDEVIESYVGISLHICSDIKDFFAVDTEEKEILTRLNATTKILLKMEHTFEDYMQLIKDLGLEIPSKWKKHWTPAEEWSYYSIDQGGSVEGLGSYEELSSARFRKENYNAFPTRELAKKAVNLSKLDRLILLWQYKNDCLFIPEWNNIDQPKHSISYNSVEDIVIIEPGYSIRQVKTYFETTEQAEKFISVYDKEIKNLLGVI